MPDNSNVGLELVLNKAIFWILQSFSYQKPIWFHPQTLNLKLQKFQLIPQVVWCIVSSSTATTCVCALLFSFFSFYLLRPPMRTLKLKKRIFLSTFSEDTRYIAFHMCAKSMPEKCCFIHIYPRMVFFLVK